VTGSGGRLHFGMVADIKSERRPTSNRNPRPDCVGIRTHLLLKFSDLCLKLRLGERRKAFAPKRSFDDLSKVSGLAFINRDADGLLPVL
jgi:hypothetical protein